MEEDCVCISLDAEEKLTIAILGQFKRNRTTHFLDIFTKYFIN